jgi:hypothetical protein
LVTKNGTFEITGELAKVFNANNAAALKDAKVELIVEDLQTAKVASLGNVVAARTGKVVGIKALTLVAPNTSFNAGGYPIPNVTITAGGVQVENLVVDELTVADGLQVTLKSVEVKELKVSEGTKLTLDPNSKIEKLVLPDGKKPSDVIANYDQVKDNIKETVDESGNTVEETPAPAPGGGGGSLPNYSGDVANAINGFIQEKGDIFQEFGDVSLEGNKIIIDVTDGDQTLADGLEVLNDNSDDLEKYIKTNYQSILDKVDNVVVSVAKASLTNTYPKNDQLFSDILKHFNLFNDLLETKGITTLGELENYYKKNNVEIKVTINFKDAQPLTYYIVFE